MLRGGIILQICFCYHEQNILNKISFDLPEKTFLLFIKIANIPIIQILVTGYYTNSSYMLQI